MTGLAGRRRLERAPVGNLRCLAQQAGFCAVAVACGGGEKNEGMVAPMSVMKRVSMIFRAKANKALDRMEDPRETLDYSYQTQLELLQKVRRGVADVATSRKRVELQINQLQQSSDKLDRQARDALAVGREDLARDALTRKAGVQSQLSDLNMQYTSLQGEEEKLTGASQRLQAKVEPSAPRRRPSRRPTPRPRRRPGSTRPSPASPRRWATSAWPSSAPRTRPSR